MKRPEKNTKELIADVLLNNTNGYLTAQDIAELTFGPQYGWHSRKTLDDKVKRNIYGAMAQLTAQNYVVIGKKNMAIKNNPIDRWKIAGPDDKDDVIIILGERERRANGAKNSIVKQIDNARKKELYPKEEQKYLES